MFLGWIYSELCVTVGPMNVCLIACHQAFTGMPIMLSTACPYRFFHSEQHRTGKPIPGEATRTCTVPPCFPRP